MAFTDRLANRGSISTETGYDIDYSLRFDNLFNYPNADPGPADDWTRRDTANNAGFRSDVSTKDSGNGQKWVMSFWHKRGASWAERGGGAADRNYQAIMGGNNSARGSWIGFGSASGTEDAFILSLKQSDQSVDFITNAQYRDYAAWYHFFIKLDTTQNTSTDRLQLWVNGVRVTSWNAYPTIAEDGEQMHFWADGVRQQLGRAYYGYGTVPCTGYLAAFYWLHNDTTGSGDATITDTSGYVATTFGEFNDDGIWIPKDPSDDITFGDQAYHLNFANSSDFGNDVGGVGNHFADYSLNTHNQCTDTPTNNFATLNPNKAGSDNSSTQDLYSHGNCGVVRNAGAYKQLPNSTIAIPKTMKTYCEFKFGGTDSSFGIASFQTDSGQYGVVGSDTTYDLSWGCYIYPDASYYGFWHQNSHTSVDTSGGTIYMLAVDQTAGKVWFGADGTWYSSGNPATGANAQFTNVSTTADLFIACNAGATAVLVNFGNPPFALSSGNADGSGYGNFEHAPPSGFLSLCTKNIKAYE